MNDFKEARTPGASKSKLGWIDSIETFWLPIANAEGAPIALAAEDGAPMVDRHCRICHASGVPIAGLYGIGLAAGFVPWGALGGEPSFRGQANGLWQWQNDVGLMIVDQVLDSVERAVA